LTVIVGGGGFVYWLNNTGGLGARAIYQVRFQSSVTGLRAGSAVLFNGIRVGEVTKLQLSSEDPRQVIATISIQDGAPVRTDTSVAVESQGLMAAPSIVLRGGTRDSPPLASSRSQPGVLVADPSATEDVSQAAREAIRIVRNVVAENAEPLRSTISNLSTFSGALARNSDHLDTIVQGLVRLAGGGPDNKPAPVYDLPAVRDVPALSRPPRGHLAVLEPTALVLYDTQRILARGPGGETVPMADAQWSDSLPKLLQAKVVQFFESAGYQNAVSRRLDGVAADTQLLLEIRAFQVSTAANPEAVVELSAQLLNDEGKFVGSRTFRATAAVQTVDPAGAVTGLSEAFGRVATDLLLWTNETM
jgi:phospholipid/cholesterol/gamma-HCH transport system substrate-binding protein